MTIHEHLRNCGLVHYHPNNLPGRDPRPGYFYRHGVVGAQKVIKIRPVGIRAEALEKELQAGGFLPTLRKERGIWEPIILPLEP